MEQQDRLITLKLTDFINIALGPGNCGGWTPIPANVAEIVLHHCKNKSLVYVEQPTKEDKHWKLWWMSEWTNSSEKNEKVRLWSEKERVARRIMEHNVRIVAAVYKEFTSSTDDGAANAKAYSLLAGGKIKSLAGLGVELNKLITKEEQL